MGRAKDAAKKVVSRVTKKPVVRRQAAKKTVDRSFGATVLREYDSGMPFADIAEKHDVKIEKVQAIVEADQAKNVTE